MGFYFKDGYEPDAPPQITQEMAQSLLNKLFSIGPSPEVPAPNAPTEVFSKTHEDASSACLHIGEDIYDLMFEQNFSKVNATIQKDEDNQLVFNLNKTEL